VSRAETVAACTFATPSALPRASASAQARPAARVHLIFSASREGEFYHVGWSILRAAMRGRPVMVLLPAGLLATLSAAPGPKEPDGAMLARQMCSTCHAFTPPDILPKASWRSEIEKMALIFQQRTSHVGEPLSVRSLCRPSIRRFFATTKRRRRLRSRRLSRGPPPTGGSSSHGAPSCRTMPPQGRPWRTCASWTWTAMSGSS
jgi:hypothetical protein